MFILSYDVETANNKNVGSICAVGWVLLDNNAIVDSGYSLINPNCQFSKYNISIHGIKPDDVVSAPSFADYWNSTLSGLMSKSIVIAHNAHFDMSATEQALFDSGLPDPGILYLDSLAIAQAYLDCSSYKLSDLASLAGYSYHEHHAGEDAMALVRVLEYIQKLCNLEDIPSLLLRSQSPIKSTNSDHFKPRKHTVQNFNSVHPSHCSDEIVPIDGLFALRRFCITGDIPGYERSDIEKIIMEHSGRPTGAVSGKTDYLIVGTFDGMPSGYLSGKTKKAIEIQEQGGKIKIIHPDEFFAMLNHEVDNI